MVVDDRTKKLLKRKLNRGRSDAVMLSQQADDKLERLFIRRLGRLVAVRRFIILWGSLFVLLFIATFMQVRGISNYYQVLKPVPGGLYNEGIVGTFTNANPIYATGSADTAVSHLVFSGLFTYDDNNQLTGDLAKSWKIGASPTEYIVSLRRGVKWHDGKPFTADDVVFTYKTIQNIEAQSSLYASWQGIAVAKADDYTVKFTLPNPLAAFPYSLTNGIIPEHLLNKASLSEMRSLPFNTSPVGTGPFVWKYVDVNGSPTSADRQQHITLAANKDYWQGRPKLDGISLITFADQENMVNAFKKKQLNAISGLEALPTDLAKDNSVHTYITPLTNEVMAFFNNSHTYLNDYKLRQALVQSVSRNNISSLTSFPVRRIDSPFLNTQFAYDPNTTQLPYDFDAANKLLDSAGYAKGADGIRTKDGKPLTFGLTTLDNQDYVRTAIFLQKEWRKLGIKITTPDYKSSDEMQTTIANHDYDVLLYGINIGVDPDVYAYWDSSQASITSQGHLNLSEYKSTAADQALEFGRTRSDPQLRAAKYKSFLSTWRADAPALALYQPNYVYISRGNVFNFERKSINSAADRFDNVQDWMIRQKKQDN